MRTAFIGIPFVWLLVFVLLPVLIVLMISLVEARIGSPPYTPIYSPDEGFSATLSNFQTLFPTTSISTPSSARSGSPAPLR